MDEPTVIEKSEKDPTKVVETLVEKKEIDKNLKILLLILALVVILPIMVLGGFGILGGLSYKSYKIPSPKPVVIDEENEEVVEDDEKTDVNYKGPYLKADLPKGWSIEENYFDNVDGEDELQDFYDMGYEGLASFQIWSEQRDGGLKPIANVSYYEAAIPPCQPMMDCITSCEYLKFSDATQDEVQSLMAYFEENKDLDEHCCQELSFTDVESYTTLNFLGNPLKRILDSDNGYNKQYVYSLSLLEVDSCISYGRLVELEGLGSVTFLLQVDKDATEAERLILDQVLESMEIIELDEEYSTFYSETSNISFSYSNTFGNLEVNVWENGNQDSLSFKNEGKDSERLYIVLAKGSVDRGGVMNGVQLEAFSSDSIESDQGLLFDMITWKVQDEDLYYLEAMYEETSRERVYMKVGGALDFDELVYFKDLFIDLIKRCEVFDEEAPSYVSRYNNSIYGSWHACDVVGSGYCERYVFNEDGTFINFLNQGGFDPEEDYSINKIYAYSGLWNIDDDMIKFSYEKEYYSDGTTEDIEVNRQYSYEGVVPEIESVMPYEWKTTIGENQFWKFGDEDFWIDEIEELN